MATKITLRGDTKANWESVNPVLSAREMVIETDTNKTKIGDGVKTYTQLSYSSAWDGTKKYVSKLIQANEQGAQVTQSILINEIEEYAFGISRSQTGSYNLLMGDSFDLSKTTFSLKTPYNTPDYAYNIYFLSSNIVKIETYMITINEFGFVQTATDGLLNEAVLEITVYQ